MKRLAIIAALGLCGCVTGAAARSSLPSALEAGWEGQPVCEKQHETETHRVLRCSFAPGIGHVRHFHPAHFGYALSGGTMRITEEHGTREVDIATGSNFSSEGIGWHEVFNVGKTTVSYIIVEER